MPDFSEGRNILSVEDDELGRGENLLYLGSLLARGLPALDHGGEMRVLVSACFQLLRLSGRTSSSKRISPVPSATARASASSPAFALGPVVRHPMAAMAAGAYDLSPSFLPIALCLPEMVAD